MSNLFSIPSPTFPHAVRPTSDTTGCQVNMHKVHIHTHTHLPHSRAYHICLMFEHIERMSGMSVCRNYVRNFSHINLPTFPLPHPSPTPPSPTPPPIQLRPFHLARDAARKFHAKLFNVCKSITWWKTTLLFGDMRAASRACLRTRADVFRIDGTPPPATILLILCVLCAHTFSLMQQQRDVAVLSHTIAQFQWPTYNHPSDDCLVCNSMVAARRDSRPHIVSSHQTTAATAQFALG